MESKSFEVLPEEAGERIDSWLARRAEELTRSAIGRLCEQHMIFVQGEAVSKNYRLRAGQSIQVMLPVPREADVMAQDIALDIVYEDSDLLVVNKPKGMVVHPAAGNEDGTLVNALLHHCKGQLSGIGGVIRPGIVHRIDKNTSGLLLVAKNDRAHLLLSEQMREHSLERCYHAVAYGSFKQPDGTVDLPIGRSPNDRKKMAVITDGVHRAREAVTHYEVLERLEGFTYLKLRLQTGRTHQIRVHLAYLGHPLAGDDVYGPKKVLRELEGQCLHAKTLGFTHPTTGERMVFDSPLPDYFERFLTKLRHKSGI